MGPLRDGILSLINMLGHDPEGGHIAQFPDIGRGQRQGNAHFVVGEAVAGVLGLRDLSVFPGLGLKIGASVGLIVLSVKRMSSAVTGSPSDQVMPSWMV